MIQLTDLFRHPIKSHGREKLTRVTLKSGHSMPWDRVWAVAHDASKADGTEWVHCANFSRVSKAPSLMAITCTLNEATETLTLSHPDRPNLTFRPDTEADKLIDWTAPLVPQDRALPVRMLRLDGRGFTDSEFPSVTLCNFASHRAVEAQIGHPLSINRWRGNIWFDGAEAWDEFDWMGKDIRIGSCILRPRQRTDRCVATTSNPETGKRDADVLAALKHWGHQDFSVRAEIIASGEIAVGETLEIL